MAARGLIAVPARVSGNGVVTHVDRREDGWTVEFMSEPRTSPQPLWFHVHCENAGGRPVRFLWANASGCLGISTETDLCRVRPVMRLDGRGWTRVADTSVVQGRLGGPSLEFGTPSGCESVDVAFCYPYAPADLDLTLAEIPDVWNRAVMGLSGEGRPVSRLDASSASGEDVPGAYVIARQHAGETPGSWVLDGLIRAVAEASPDDALRRIEWWVVPFVDLDGVIEGNYGKDALPWDFNRAWCRMPMRPEVLTLQQDMRRFAARFETRTVLDLHGPGGAENGLYQFLARDGRPPAQREAQATLLPHLANAMAEIDSARLQRIPDYPSRWGTTDTVGNWAWDFLDETPAVSIETAYQGLTEGAWLDTAGYRDVGRRLAQAIARWLLDR